MRSNPRLRRWLSFGLTVIVFGLLVGIVTGKRDAAEPAAEKAATTTAGGTGWPMFGGTINRNMVNLLDRNLPAEWDSEEKTNVKWEAQLGSRAYGGPTIAGGKIYVGTNNGSPRNPDIKGDKGIIMCFREADGEFLWQAVHDKLPSGQVHDWPNEGICSTPAVEGNRVYYVSNRCEVVCADVEGFHDGKNDGVQDEKYKSQTDADIIWRLDMMKDLRVFPHNLAACSPVIAGDVVFVVTANGVDEGHINIPAPMAPSFIAIDKKTGKLLWQDNSPGNKIMHGQWSNPTVATVNGTTMVIFPGGDGWLRGFEPQTGKLLWQFDCNPKDSKYELGGRGTKNDFIATPVVHDNKLYIGVGQDPEHYEGVGHMWCIDLVKALEKGKTNPNNDVSPVNDIFDASNPINKNSALVWHYGGPADAEKTGRDYVYGRTMSTVAVHDGLVYAAELAGYLHCLDAQTGKLYWVHDLKSAIWGSPYWVDGKVYLGNEDGDIYVYQHGKELKVLGRNEMPHSVKSTPVAVNGVLYVMTEAQLFALANK